MPVEHVTRAVLIDDLALAISAWRYVCDFCGNRETFPDSPMPEGRGEGDAGRRGWRICWDSDEEKCRCPACAATASNATTKRLAVAELRQAIGGE